MSGARPYSIFIDPGHGGKDPGAISPDGKNIEKNIVLDIGRLLRRCILDGDYLFYPYMTRLSDRYLTLGARCKLANDKKADLFISLHCNSAESVLAESVLAEGLEVWYHKNGQVSKFLASELYPALMSAIPDINGRGIKEGTFYVLEHTIMPAVLIEFEFLSHPKEYVSDIAVQRRTAVAIAETVEEFLEAGEY